MIMIALADTVAKKLSTTMLPVSPSRLDYIRNITMMLHNPVWIIIFVVNSNVPFILC